MLIVDLKIKYRLLYIKNVKYQSAVYKIDFRQFEDEKLKIKIWHRLFYSPEFFLKASSLGRGVQKRPACPEGLLSV
jgi:hypothetical protein